MRSPLLRLLMTTIGIVLMLCILENTGRAQRGGDTDFAVNRHKEYIFVSAFKLSWHKAMEYCRSRNMFLVSIQNQEELEAVKDTIIKSSYLNKNARLHMWTSLNDIGDEGQYVWASTGLRNTLDAWRDGEPNNAYHSSREDEDCVALVHLPDIKVSYSLDDRNCSWELEFMCET